MKSDSRTSYSSSISMVIQIGERTVRLGELLGTNGTLLDLVTVPADTKAQLIINVDGQEWRENILLDEGIAEGSNRVSFVYDDFEELLRA